MITSLKISQYIDSCVNKYKDNFHHNEDNNDDYDFLMFRYSPTFLYFETKYGVTKVNKEIESELMNMNEQYNIRCQRLKLESERK